MNIETIHESLINGNRKQMVEQINEEILYDFWADYRDYLELTYESVESRLTYYQDAVISYFRITNG